ncbi:uncharacterized protein TRAVEDRAFT_54437 [Trametes versicolor FP-101664 SS1]|uniref:Uncharacterized protein n=1 Tax=Trametes versicolor (strain FP-101664) TaxID=717944 RepID=R7S7B7_TRAVS|nr:uncharacterized protein TRAVEDRAFT_54437 [Trametes versicolor FP-101664 SS1]EIW51505.1 hypothetical protein TRAVEDRAFT_54437 [Trametes versicolor FP-101664 SS1]
MPPKPRQRRPKTTVLPPSSPPQPPSPTQGPEERSHRIEAARATSSSTQQPQTASPNAPARNTTRCESDQPTTNSPVQVARHPYGTRRSTQTARPAFAAGLAKRTREEIHQGATQKVAEKQRKQAQKADKAKRIEQNTRKLAQLEDEYVSRQAQDDRELRAAPPPAEHGSVPNERPHSGGAAGKAAVGGHPPVSNLSRTSVPGSNGANTSQALRATNVPRTSTSHSNVLDGNASSSGSETEDDLEAALSRINPSRSTGQRKTRAAQDAGYIRDKGSDTPSTRDGANYSSDGLAGDPAWGDTLESGAFENDLADDAYHRRNSDLNDLHSVDSHNTDDPDAMNLDLDAADLDEVNADPDADLDEVDHADLDTVNVNRMRSTPLTEAQRKQLKRVTVRGTIAGLRQHNPSPAPSNKRLHDDRSISPRPHKSKRQKAAHASRENAFRTEFRHDRRSRSEAPSSQAAPAPSSQSLRLHTQRGGGRSGWRAALKNEPSDAGCEEELAADEPPAAFTDADVQVASSQRYALTAATTRAQSVFRVEVIDDNDAMDIVNGRAKKGRRRRRAPTDIPEEKSRSTSNLPDFIKAVFESKFVPTIIDYYGTKRNPWDLREHGSDEFLEVCREALKMACPDVDYTLEKSDVAYRIARQKVYQWRTEFSNAAVLAINDAMHHKFGIKPAADATKRWVEAAIITDGGEAFWAIPHANVDHAHGKLQSAYVLKAFAVHLTFKKGSVGDYGYPAGALALATAAVEHSFPMFKWGVFTAGEGFNTTTARARTEWWYDTATFKFAKKPEYFNAIIRMASRHAITAPQASHTPSSSSPAPNAFDRSSPPIEYYTPSSPHLTLHCSHA